MPSNDSIVESEINAYFRMRAIEVKDDREYHEWEPIQKFWAEQESRDKLPLMCKLARKLLATPASSVYSERLFSEMGNLYEKKRSRLLPGRAQNIIFCHHNLPLLDKIEAQAKKKAEKAKASK